MGVSGLVGDMGIAAPTALPGMVVVRTKMRTVPQSLTAKPRLEGVIAIVRGEPISVSSHAEGVEILREDDWPSGS